MRSHSEAQGAGERPIHDHGGHLLELEREGDDHKDDKSDEPKGDVAALAGVDVGQAEVWLGTRLIGRHNESTGLR